MKKNVLYTRNNEAWEKECDKNYLEQNFNNKPEILKNGIILPAKIIDETTKDYRFAGGVTDEKFNFKGGLFRKREKFNYSCNEGYEVEEKDVIYKDEDVIFGGVIIPMFGHFFLESLSRLWWVIENTDNKDKIAFIIYHNKQASYYMQFFKLLGIDESRIIFIDKPTKFRQIIVPEQTFRIHLNYNEKFTSIYDKMCSNVKPSKYKKIYLTRTKLPYSDCLNEEFFEKFYEKRGFKIVSPEQLSVEDQISIINGAEEIVSTIGTLTHLAVFCKPKTKILMLTRTTMPPLIPQVIINQIRDIDFAIVDVGINFLPVKHEDRCFLIGPTKLWIEYNEHNDIIMSSKEKSIDMEKFALKFIANWCENYKNPKKWRISLKNLNSFDFLNCISTNLFNEELETEKYEIEKTKNVKKIIEENNKYKAKIYKLEKEIKKIRNSKSWKITSVFRKVSKKLGSILK